jgi:hypothetical protein
MEGILWRSRQQSPPNGYYLYASLHNAISHKTAVRA